MNLKFFPLLLAGLLFSNALLADEFSDVLFSLQIESQAQANYFSRLIEEYREMADQNRFTIKGQPESVAGSANASQQSQKFGLF